MFQYRKRYKTGLFHILGLACTLGFAFSMLYIWFILLPISYLCSSPLQGISTTKKGGLGVFCWGPWWWHGPKITNWYKEVELLWQQNLKITKAWENTRRLEEAEANQMWWENKWSSTGEWRETEGFHGPGLMGGVAAAVAGEAGRRWRQAWHAAWGAETTESETLILTYFWSRDQMDFQKPPKHGKEVNDFLF